jgi:hypothetical protein
MGQRVLVLSNGRLIDDIPAVISSGGER